MRGTTTNTGVRVLTSIPDPAFAADGVLAEEAVGLERVGGGVEATLA